MKYEPYFGWCDVDGCKEEGAAGGCYWSDTGYWTTCHKHSQDARDGKPQPKMKMRAIKREASRDKKTGYLKTTHGGKRKGAGRKPKEPTVVKRIPISKLESVQNLLDSKLVITHPERKKK